MTDTTDTTPEYQSLRAKQKLETRQLVYRKAREQFMIHGYEGVGIREIAKACGMSTGAVNGNCEGKADLYQKVMGHRPVFSETGSLAIAALASIGWRIDRGGSISERDIDALQAIGRRLAGMIELSAPDDINVLDTIDEMVAKFEARA